MSKVILGIGGNIYPRIYYIYRSLNAIQKNIGFIEKQSSIYHTKPWKMSENTPFFYNMCVSVSTSLLPHEILEVIKSIEQNLGRKKENQNKNVYTSRTIDIDILFFNDDIINTQDLIIPHPLLHQREFVLRPLLEIDADKEHPVLRKKIRELILCENTSV